MFKSLSTQKIQSQETIEKDLSMKKKYLIIAECIYDVGGEQIYTENKYSFLKKNGWDVFIFSISKGKSIMMKELKIFENGVIEQLRYYPFLLKKKLRDKTINKIITEINNENNCEIVIESHGLSTAVWGEMIAHALNCKHFIFLLQEKFFNSHQAILDFFDFKHKRKELSGIKKESLELLFKNYKKLEDNEKYFLSAVCTSKIVKIDNIFLDKLTKKDVNIGCISRLQKPYIRTMIDEIIHFAKKYREKKIQLVIVGSAPNRKIIQDIKNQINPINNISLTLTGTLYPIPQKLFDLIDVFIGTSGASYFTSNEGALTISIDVVSNKPLGFLKYDPQKGLYSRSEMKTSISEMLEEVFIMKKKIKNVYYEKKIETVDYMKEFESHIGFINNSNQIKKYFIFSSKKIGGINLAKKFVIHLAGVNGYEKSLKLYSHLNSIGANFKF